jgi:hypothetical protein
MPKIIRRTVRRTRLMPHAVVIQPAPVVSIIKEEVLISNNEQINLPAQIVETILPVVEVQQQEQLVKLA